MYNNLIYFLVAIFLFSMGSVTEDPSLSLLQSGLIYLLLVAGYGAICRRIYSKVATDSSSSLFRAEKKLSIIALIFYGASLYLCDIKYFLEVFSLGGKIPALSSILGLGFFVVFLSIMWSSGCFLYESLFGGERNRFKFIITNIKTNLPIVLPWILFSMASDLVLLLPFPGLHAVLETAWGDFFFFLVFFLFVLFLLPPLVQRLWRCRPLPDGTLRQHLDDFCARQNFTAKYFIWPLMEGRAMTAGVMGIVPGMRYILLTPAIIDAMSPEELDAIVAHEIAHVKKFHILLFLCLILGFSLVVGFLAEPLLYSVLSFDLIIDSMVRKITNPEVIVSLVSGVPMLILLVVYFRYLFGFFMRNFERQADLYTIAVMGSAKPLISAFDKISFYTGVDRKETNWHHFGIGERIDSLQRAEEHPEYVEQHNRKVRNCLAAYFVCLALLVGVGNMISTTALEHHYKEKYAEAALFYSADQEPGNPLWPRLIGDMKLSQSLIPEAMVAYRRALDIDPDNPNILNNLAWLLVTNKDATLRDPEQALTLARRASIIAPSGHILDTLATSYWATGLVGLAVETERLAMQKDPGNIEYYRLRIELFLRQNYQESFPVVEHKGE